MRDDQFTIPNRHENGVNAHHDDLEEEDDKDAREGEARAVEKHQEEQRGDDDPLDVLRVSEASPSAPVLLPARRSMVR